MKIAITTPRGNIGRQLVRILQDQGQAQLVLLDRKPDQLAPEQARGAVVISGDLLDADYVQQATVGVDALFWLIPPNFQSTDYVGYYQQSAHVAATAIRANKIGRVVLLSSVGATLNGGVGPINGFYGVEAIFRDVTHAVGSQLVILRPAFLMENLLQSLGGMIQAQSLFLPISGQVQQPMVATKDIASVAAQALTDPSLSGQILPLYGSRDYSYDQVASILSQELGQPIHFVQIPPEQLRQALIGMGASEHMADLTNEMYAAIDSGYLIPDPPRSPASTTPTTLEEFIRLVLKPSFMQAKG